eukprot:TRINITY_DN21361_c0_g1_i1.p1 TRINITY_DN21361_c0_g1~~TRINITY_DN21361_c0_g1_i1.p1  ORF type:complete len:424 (+),score=29.92 TRINITY_DN21361_c0_g1_i1:50-1321(+)
MAFLRPSTTFAAVVAAGISLAVVGASETPAKLRGTQVDPAAPSAAASQAANEPQPLSGSGDPDYQHHLDKTAFAGSGATNSEQNESSVEHFPQDGEAPEPVPQCTVLEDDPHQTGEEVSCCADLFKCLLPSSWTYKCRASCSGCHECIGSPTQAPTPRPPMPPTPAAPYTQPFPLKALVWNVYYQNYDITAIAETISHNDADIVGLNEFSADREKVLQELNARNNTRRYKWQPGLDRFHGYGTDILFDDARWDFIDGGKDPVYCDHQPHGHRGRNWAVLKERQTGDMFAAGGIHLSFCHYKTQYGDGCDSTHECELNQFYDKMESLQEEFGNVQVLWMGDLNMCPGARAFNNLLQGLVGSRTVFKVDDLALTQGNTYINGGCPIDHILAESGRFERVEGGKTGQIISGQPGADHYPVYANSMA